ncbi:glycosyltransferase family 4 protein [Rhodanobacter lindaniclasticus]
MAWCRHDPVQCSAILRSLDIFGDPIVLGYCGRMHRGKGILTWFDAATAAMAQVPRLHCLWLGNGPDAQALRDRAAAHPLGCRHHFPRLGRTTSIPWYSAMLLLAFPSIAPETFGRVSVEAQAAGLPVLASDVGGIPETLQPGVTGVLLPPGDVDAWRAAIVDMCDASRRLPMGAAAEAFVREHFSTSVISAQFVQPLAAATSTSGTTGIPPYRPRGMRRLPGSTWAPSLPTAAKVFVLLVRRCCHSPPTIPGSIST